MGMYTELFVTGELKDDAPTDVIDITKALFDRTAEFNGPLPDHPFFRCARWRSIGNSCSYYFTPFSLSCAVHDSISNSLHFTSRSDLKNYDNEIEKFLDWIKPYCDRIRGYHIYEEAMTPTTFGFED